MDQVMRRKKKGANGSSSEAPIKGSICTSTSDSMWQLAQHLSILLQNNNKSSGMIVNSFLNSPKLKWILDSGAKPII
jgi:hypothetical protein